MTSKQKRDKSPPENELKCRRLRAYDDAIAMLQSIRALPETNNIKLRLASRESPPKKSTACTPLQDSNNEDISANNNNDLQPLSVDDSEAIAKVNNDSQKYDVDVIIKTPGRA